MTLFRILVGIDGVIALIFLYFFVVGLGDGSVSSRNMLLWLVILGGIAAALGGGLSLQSNGKRALANGLLFVLAGPGLAFGLFFLSLLVLQPRWN